MQADENPLIALTGASQDLSRQLRHLVLTEPFGRLIADQVHWLPDGKAEQLDLRYLALALLDMVMERSTMDVGCTLDEAARFGAELLLALDATLTDAQAQNLARKTLDLLLNARERHQEFRVRYYDPARRDWMAHSFRLLRIAAGEDGLTRLKPGDAALTLQLAMLDISPEFMAEAESLMIRKAIERGRFADAQSIAARARLRSLDYQSRLRERLFRIQRAPEAFSWRDEVLPQLKHARTHLEERQAQDATLMDAVREHLPLTREAKARAALIQLKATLEDAATRHNRLHADVMQANERFRKAQESAFRARRRAPVPDPEAQLLMPLLQAPLAVLAAQGEVIWAACAHTRVPKQIHLASLFEACLAAAPTALPAQDEAIEELLMPLPERFSAELIASTEHWLKSRVADGESWRISQTLALAEDEQWSDARRRCALHVTLRSFSPQDDRLGMTVQYIGTMQHALAAGDDLECQRDAERWPA